VVEEVFKMVNSLVSGTSNLVNGTGIDQKNSETFAAKERCATFPQNDMLRTEQMNGKDPHLDKAHDISGHKAEIRSSSSQGRKMGHKPSNKRVSLHCYMAIHEQS
jgi:hypothetical protein